MPVPMVIAGAVIGSAVVSALSNIYQTKKTSDVYDKAYNYNYGFQTGAYSENQRYFEDYIRRHHLGGRTIKYPYRTGYLYDMSKMYTAIAGLNANKVNRMMSYVNGANNIVRGVSMSTLYNNTYVPKQTKPSTMYGWY